MTRTKKILTATAAATALGAFALAGIADAHDRDGRWQGWGRGGHHGQMMDGPMMGRMMDGPLMGGMRGGMMQQFFKLADENKDGKVTKEEIEKLRDAKFGQYDANNDGKLSLDEFQGLLNDLTRERTVRAFQHLDPDGDAAISKEELDDRVATMIQHMDRNDDGVISRDDAPRWRMRGEHRGPGMHRGGPGMMDQRPGDNDDGGDAN